MSLSSALKKFGLSDIFELVLFLLPKGYHNFFLSQELICGQIATLEVEILQYTSAKLAKIKAWALLFDCEIDLIIFHPKAYHQAIFKPKERLFIQAKVQKQQGFVQLLQPKVIQHPNRIIPIFKTKKHKSATLLELCKQITHANLQAYCAMPKDYEQAIITLFHPTLDFLESFLQQDGFFGPYLEAIKFIEIYQYMKKLQQKKTIFPSIKPLSNDISAFIESLPFCLTKGQKQAIEEIKQSLQSTIATRRIIVGDVGCGKTIVILAAAMLAYPHGCVLMAPTSLLAKQIYQEAIKFLPSFMQIALYTQNEQKNFQNSCDFSYDLLIGTHALLYQKIPNFALVIIDEQHRFGTAQRNSLEKKISKQERRAHFLQFSATPIPRTLAMIESSFLDFSFIEDLPFAKDITTRIIHKQDFKALLAHLLSEITKGHQAIIVYPLVKQGQQTTYLPLQESEGFWRKHFNHIYLTHGKDKQKDQILEAFKAKGNILLTTTVIEVGISLPRLSTIVIVGAERLGLATLHQLRGRVSRNGLKGYCFLYTHQSSNPRLEQFSNITNGFELAKLDLQFRDGGDLLSGEQQSGKQFAYIDLAQDEAIIQKAKELL